MLMLAIFIILFGILIYTIKLYKEEFQLSDSGSEVKKYVEMLISTNSYLKHINLSIGHISAPYETMFGECCKVTLINSYQIGKNKQITFIISISKNGTVIPLNDFEIGNLVYRFKKRNKRVELSQRETYQRSIRKLIYRKRK